MDLRLLAILASSLLCTAHTPARAAETPENTVAPASSAAAPAPRPRNRAEATAVVGELRRIVTPNGIERNTTVRIGGIDQFVSIRGADRRNPVLLIVHGGPGFPTMPMAWWTTRALEEYFTVVHWDQRGAGRTYLLNDPEAVAPTMKPERFVDDTDELVRWLRKELHKERIFLLGTSWGSYVGLQFARRRPDWLHAYIGVGQAVNSPESERRGYAYALAAAKRAGNREAVAELEALAPYAAPGQPIPLEHVAIQRKWSDYFGGVMAYRTSQVDGIAARLSPDYSDADAPRVYEGNGYSQRFLFGPVLELDFSDVTRLDCPLIVFAGRHDRSVNSYVAREWFDRVRAPFKQFVWFENSAHEVLSEEPGKALLSLVQHALPLAARAGDGVGGAEASRSSQ
jgi:pimeloyl-ACP methyl ester carboxylesterase